MQPDQEWKHWKEKWGFCWSVCVCQQILPWCSGGVCEVYKLIRCVFMWARVTTCSPRPPLSFNQLLCASITTKQQVIWRPHLPISSWLTQQLHSDTRPTVQPHAEYAKSIRSLAVCVYAPVLMVIHTQHRASWVYNLIPFVCVWLVVLLPSGCLNMCHWSLECIRTTTAEIARLCGRLGLSLIFIQHSLTYLLVFLCLVNQEFCVVFTASWNLLTCIRCEVHVVYFWMSVSTATGEQCTGEEGSGEVCEIGRWNGEKQSGLYWPAKTSTAGTKRGWGWER